MKVLVVGSGRHIWDGDEEPEAGSEAERRLELLRSAGESLGRELAARGHTIIVGSDHERDIDPHVVRGALTHDAASAKLEVHVPKGLEAQFPHLTEGRISTVWHQFPDWDVTSMEVIRGVDAVLAIGGRRGVIHAGISAWMMDKPVIPVGSFGGGAETVGQYGSSRRSEFYHGGLDDQRIDSLASPWERGIDAPLVVDALEAVAKSAALGKVPRSLLLGVFGLMALALLGWVLFLTYPFVAAPRLHSGTWSPENNFLLIFPTVSAAGLLGATMQTLRSIRRGDRISWRVIVVDTMLGLAAGMVAAILYLLAQVGVNGAVNVAMENPDYVRVGIVVSLASLFAALYLDTALAYFDRVSDRVIAGKYDEG